jgi:hypothetical protein
MGTAREPARAKLFLAVMWAEEAEAAEALTAFGEEWGTVDFFHGPVLFDFTDYYAKEMGSTLRKSYYTFAEPVDRGSLPVIKNFTNAIERQHTTAAGCRPINLDPGYLTNDKLVLASTKDFFHRIYLDRGIYAEVTLHYRQGRWRHFSWTYPDYRTEGVCRFLDKARAKLVGETRKRRDHGQQTADRG